MDLTQYIRDIPDFPKPGILFKDITPLLADPEALRQTISELSSWVSGQGADLVLGAYNDGWYERPDLGTYVLSSLRLDDFSGNSRTYTNKDYGGDTDFSKYFPSTTIEVSSGWPKKYLSGIAMNTRITSPMPVTQAAIR